METKFEYDFVNSELPPLLAEQGWNYIGHQLIHNRTNGNFELCWVVKMSPYDAWQMWTWDMNAPSKEEERKPESHCDEACHNEWCRFCTQ